MGKPIHTVRRSGTVLTVVGALGTAALSVLGAQTAVGDTVTEGRPNIVFVMLDDLDAKAVPYMPFVQSSVAAAGMTLENFLFTQALCCPSRTTMLRGQYSHSTGVLSNERPFGGYGRFYDLGIEESTIATWLQAADYSTAHVGRYLNGYPEDTYLPYTHVPPGWDNWFGVFSDSAERPYGYQANDNGVVVQYGDTDDDYLTTVIARETLDYLAGDLADQPFYIEVTPRAPHLPAEPARRHADLFPEVTYPKDPAFNEAWVMDKPSFLRDNPRLKPAAVARIDHLFRQRIRSLQAVDEMIADIVSLLQEQGKLANTYIFVGSDNGYHMGEHRLPVGKNQPYRTDTEVPYYVFGPDIQPGSVASQLVGNVDLPTTFADIAGAPTPAFVEGRSLLPILRGEDPPWRTVFLHERRTGAHPYIGLRTPESVFVTYDNGEGEYYRLVPDPYQLRNGYATMDDGLKQALSIRADELAACSGAACRDIESAPL